MLRFKLGDWVEYKLPLGKVRQGELVAWPEPGEGKWGIRSASGYKTKIEDDFVLRKIAKPHETKPETSHRITKM